MLSHWKMLLCGSICVAASFAIGSPITAQVASAPATNGIQAANPQTYSQQQRPAHAATLTPQQQAAMEQAAQQALRESDAVAIAQPQRPFAELSSEDTKYLHQFLDYWQQSSDQVNQYKCEFRRFKYDSGIVNWRDPTTNRLAAAEIAIGEIRYAEPDKGFYETSEIWDFKAPPKAAGEDADYTPREDDSAKEKWICDGRSIYEFNFSQKQLMETEIPKDMQGSGLVNSPIPFLFGANKEKILDRYWVRVVPQNVETEYWLEAFPKRIEDARLYSKIEIIVDSSDFLPKAMHMYGAQYDPAKNNFNSYYFAFENRKVNDQLDKIQDFFNRFVRPQTPITGGWRRVKNSSAPIGKQAIVPGENNQQR